jgi:hypothetical protein
VIVTGLTDHKSCRSAAEIIAASPEMSERHLKKIW